MIWSVKKILWILIPVTILFVAGSAAAVYFYTLDWAKKNPPKHLVVDSITFYSGSFDGPVNEEKIYEIGEGVFWKIKLNGEKPQENRYHTQVARAGTYIASFKLKDKNYGNRVNAAGEFRIVHSKVLKIDPLHFDSSVFRSDAPIQLIFNVMGFKPANGAMTLTEDLLITDDTGGSFLDKPGLLQVTDPWQGEDLVSLQNSLDIPIPGTYQLKITVHDQNSGMEAVTEAPLKVE